ncbi:alpha,alpha-trehalase TreF [Arundinibacter roseus]|uniref:Alpha,alpha-trehalase TreF n=1 Tax=Arundinibacter roseus TaxID=2070510 RepID=A0A4R4KII5_9BACT|nr:alpha,alpha-trehalase TreF [Arundinibacter roseus]
MTSLKLATSASFGQAHTSPDDLLGPLFEAVQMSRIFDDSKTFADCIPRMDPPGIIEEYIHQKDHPDFSLEAFVREYFRLPHLIKTKDQADEPRPLSEHIHRLWSRLSRKPEDQRRGGSLIPLPEPYVVPGGRFREIYYWDSYFTMLGLRESGRQEMIEHMINNFVYLLDNFGHIPTGNRTYYLSRSQPPFFALMIRLYSEMEGKKILLRYLPQLRREYDYWMDGADRLTKPYSANRRAVLLPNGTVLNRYWDDRATPRPESYFEDVEHAHASRDKFGMKPEKTYRHIRAAAESGWDFSSRWMADGKTFESTETTDILPVDLNCLMYYLENTLAEAYYLADQYELYRRFDQKARLRQAAIQQVFWDPKRQFYMDFNFVKNAFTPVFTLAGVFPLYFKLASHQQARFINAYIRLNFMRSGGVLTSLNNTGQQWDVPNGWAPLQWIVYKGLRNYNFDKTAENLRLNFMNLVEKHYQATGDILEKYNVSNTKLVACGGEYAVQEGFGWTNGVYLKLKKQKSI